MHYHSFIHEEKTRKIAHIDMRTIFPFPKLPTMTCLMRPHRQLTVLRRSGRMGRPMRIRRPVRRRPVRRSAGGAIRRIEGASALGVAIRGMSPFDFARFEGRPGGVEKAAVAVVVVHNVIVATTAVVSVAVVVKGAVQNVVRLADVTAVVSFGKHDGGAGRIERRRGRGVQPEIPREVHDGRPAGVVSVIQTRVRVEFSEGQAQTGGGGEAAQREKIGVAAGPPTGGVVDVGDAVHAAIVVEFEELVFREAGEGAASFELLEGASSAGGWRVGIAHVRHGVGGVHGELVLCIIIYISPFFFIFNFLQFSIGVVSK